MGIDLPQGLDHTSGNVTPTPTTGELEELSISSAEQQTVVEDIRSSQGSRATPLKSLLKKPSVDLSSDSESEVISCCLDTTMLDFNAGWQSEP